MVIVLLRNSTTLDKRSLETDTKWHTDPFFKCSPVEMLWHTVKHGRGSEEETCEWSG
jgi:hypothetical protein